MTYENAKIIIGAQERSIRKLNGLRFTVGDFEYRLTYRGGFAAYIAIDRRKIGTRNFKYFPGIGLYDCFGNHDALIKVYEHIKLNTETETK